MEMCTCVYIGGGMGRGQCGKLPTLKSKHIVNITSYHNTNTQSKAASKIKHYDHFPMFHCSRQQQHL